MISICKKSNKVCSIKEKTRGWVEVNIRLTTGSPCRHLKPKKNNTIRKGKREKAQPQKRSKPNEKECKTTKGIT
jgi:hypothetical protein